MCHNPDLRSRSHHHQNSSYPQEAMMRVLVHLGQFHKEPFFLTYLLHWIIKKLSISFRECCRITSKLEKCCFEKKSVNFYFTSISDFPLIVSLIERWSSLFRRLFRVSPTIKVYTYVSITAYQLELNTDDIFFSLDI